MKKDNCKDCVSKCEHAGKDREFVCIGGVSCKVEEAEDKVSVIRCKDCKYCEILAPVKEVGKEAVVGYKCLLIRTYKKAEGFCDYAERRE